MTKVQCARQRSTARVLMIITIVFWLWFGIGSAYAERASLLNWLMHTPVPGGTFILSLSTLVAWRWEGIGGTLLALEGIVALGFITGAFLWGSFTASTLVLMWLTLGFPPLAAGILFLIHWQQSAAARSRDSLG